MRGRRPIPTETKRRNGNPGRRPLNELEPSSGGKPAKPEGLCKTSAAFWDELVECFSQMGILSRVDGLALELLSRTYGHWQHCLAKIKNCGEVVEWKAKNGEMIVKTSPYVRMAADAEKRLRSLLIEFGMTPASRVPLGLKQHQPGATPPISGPG